MTATIDKPEISAIESVSFTPNVYKRDQSTVVFDAVKIYNAIKNAFLDVMEQEDLNHTNLDQQIQKVTLGVIDLLKTKYPSLSVISIEEIQDSVEETLMRSGFYHVARSYILYRNERQSQRQEEAIKNINIKEVDGTLKPYKNRRFKNMLIEYSQHLKDINIPQILQEVERSIFNGIEYREVLNAIILAIRTKIEINPDYSFLASRVTRHIVIEEALSFFKGKHTKITPETTDYSEYFEKYLDSGIAHDLINPKVKEFDLTRIQSALQCDRDFLLSYLSIQTLYDRYFIHVNDERIELPQFFFMRVAMGLCMNEDGDKTEKAIQFYHTLSKLEYMCSTPTLFNAATNRPQLSSCFLTTIDDDLNDIFGALKDNALLSKFAGGIGNDWSNVRAARSKIKSTNGSSDGIVPFLNVADATAIAVNQGGKRKGAVCAYLTTWHMDIFEFLDLRKNTGDDRRRTHDMNTANWIPDLFMSRVRKKENWTLFSPDEVPGLHSAFGQAFKELYESYEAKAQQGLIRSKTVPAQKLWRKMLSMLFETGHPWLTFKDPCNERSPQRGNPNAPGSINSSNLCTEITLNTTPGPDGEVAVCNLGSINLVKHLDQNNELDKQKLKATIHQAVRLLDNVIDMNYYTIPQAKNANMRHRPVGLGIMGFQDVLYRKKLAYDSQEAITFADRSMELISYYAIEASIQLAKERGTYPSYEGSQWSKGLLPIDTIKLLRDIREEGELNMDETTTLDWEPIRQALKQHGIRNSNIMAIAPTATISNICGVSQSIEPIYQHLFVKSNMSGEFTIINQYLIDALKEAGIWDRDMMLDIKFHNGSIQAINRIPQDIKDRFRTAFEINPKYLVDCASRRQKWIDQSQSLNLYMEQASGKKLDELYQHAWLSGLKTTYYLRSLGATNAERSTVTDGALNAVNKTPNICSIDNPDCEACQ
ncbi:MAG: ribonucleoside-diphosphate reductase subunit alpha [Candidatus Comchoanobacterales bacterium]